MQQSESSATVRVRFEPQGTTVTVRAGATIAEAAETAGLAIDKPCGGRGRCGKCLVYVEGQAGAVLACQERLSGHTVVRMPAAPLPRDIVSLVEGRPEAFTVTPPLAKTYFPPAFLKESPRDGLWGTVVERACRESRGAGDGSAGDAPSDADREVRREAVDPRADNASLSTLRSLGAVYDDARSEGFTAVTCGDRLLACEAGDTTIRLMGLAVDIGTTTVVGYLYDLASGAAGSRLAVASSLNRQAVFGGDVISRIAAAQRDGSPARLRAEVLATVAEVIREACAAAGRATEDIYEVVAVGNTTMHHLFFGIHPVSLGWVPFWTVCREALSVEAREFPELGINPLGRVTFLPLIGGHVGADTTAAVLATGMHLGDRARLLIDIGTNGELVLGSGRGLWACSTAAGPALEGAGISCGMRATPGAIDGVRITPEGVTVTTVGDRLPLGLCGSGVVSAVAEMLRAGVLRADGRMADPGGHGFTLVEAEKSGTGRPIVFTQADVRAVQLAKGAIGAGVALLCETTGIDPSALSEILLAGAFGNYLDIADAKRIGLLPDLPGIPIRPVGNAAGAGAQMCLLSREKRSEAWSLASEIEPVELARHPDFQKVFARNLAFPPG